MTVAERLSDTPPHSWDPDVAVVVSALRDAIPLQQLGVGRAREMLEKIPRPPGPDMHAVTGLDVPGPHGPIPVRIYRPRSAPRDDAPAVVWCHGGGMIMGSLDSFDRMAREVASVTHAVVVNVGYRLAPEHRYPVANDEAVAVVRWMRAHHRRWSVDADRIAVGGDSAGGSLAAATALRLRDDGDPPPAQQILVYPGIERRTDRPSMRIFGNSPFLTADDIDWMKGLYLGDDPSTDDHYGVPASADNLRDLPPAIVVCGSGDPLRDAVEDYGHRLREDGVMTASLRYPGVGHGFLMQTAAFARARQAMSDIGALVVSRFQ